MLVALNWSLEILLPVRIIAKLSAGARAPKFYKDHLISGRPMVRLSVLEAWTSLDRSYTQSPGLVQMPDFSGPIQTSPD